MVAGAEVALVAYGEEEVASWTVMVLVACPEVAVVEIEVASMVARAWTEVALVEEDEVALEVLLDLWWNTWEEEEEGVEDLENG